jgi:hypothetical protein
MNEQPQATAEDDGVETPTTGTNAKVRPAYIESSGSEATRELRDQSRRRREAEEKLQQHLQEAKEHSPHSNTHTDPAPDDAGPDDAGPAGGGETPDNRT